jgi:hypothetical protein
MPIGWITGWEAIAAYVDVSLNTAKKLHLEYGMPVRVLPTGLRVILPFEVDTWLILFNKKLEEAERKEPKGKKKKD